MLRRDGNYRRGDWVSKGSGVCVYIHKSLETDIIHAFKDTPNLPEYIIIEIRPNRRSKIWFCALHRPPMTDFLNEFFDDFSNFAHAYSDIVIVGAFNADMLSNDNVTTRLIDFFSSQNVHLVPSGPTYHVFYHPIYQIPDSHIWLDLVIVDRLEKILNFHQTGIPFLLGHELISFDYKCYSRPCTLLTSTHRDFRNWGNFNFLNSVCTLLLDGTSPTVNGELNLAILNDALTSVLDSNAPYRTYTLSKRTPAHWLSPDIKRQIRLREQLRNKFGRNPNFIKSLFSKQHNKLKSFIESNRNIYQLKKLADCSNTADY